LTPFLMLLEARARSTLMPERVDAYPELSGGCGKVRNLCTMPARCTWW
jgi:hypothetical protein